MYSCLEKEYNGPYISYINYKNNWNIEHQKEKTAAKLDIPVKNIQTSPGRENMEELLCIDIVVITAILLFFCIIFSGIYRIQLIARQEQYGVLRAIGIKKNIFKQNILLSACRRKECIVMKLYLRYMKEYKKNTVTVFLCFLLTVVLISGLLILMHTNHRVEALQNMLTHTPADVRITSLNENQVEILRNDSDISKMAIFEKPEYVLCDENRIYFQCGDDLGITLTGRLEKGRMPENETEVVMEKWVLLNLGKEPDINQEITLENENTGVVGQCQKVLIHAIQDKIHVGSCGRNTAL